MKFIIIVFVSLILSCSRCNSQIEQIVDNKKVFTFDMIRVSFGQNNKHEERLKEYHDGMIKAFKFFLKEQGIILSIQRFVKYPLIKFLKYLEL